MMRFQPERYCGIILESPLLQAEAFDDSEPPIHFADWEAHSLAVDDQGRTGTCAAQAKTGIMETMLSYWSDGRIRVQLDALKFYRLVWEKENNKPWPGDVGYSTGLRGYSTFTFGKELGLLPLDAEMIPADWSPRGLKAALYHSPLFCATCVTEAWRKPGEYGEIVPAEITTSGHAWRLPGMRSSMESPIDRRRRQMISGANSWSEDWGYFGHFSMAARLFTLHSYFKPFGICADWKKWVLGGEWKRLLRGSDGENT
jgi:hypothetical protein